MTIEQNIYSRLKQIAVRTAEVIGKPSFYTEHANELEISRELLKTNALITQCLSYLDDAAMFAGHGVSHAEAVALDAGVILQIEGRLQHAGSESISDLILYVQIAAMFHDIKRKEKDHTLAGSVEAGRILDNFEIEDRYKRYIVDAIRNHEAFKEVLESENAIAKLISDSLYDADKFRWGPDNFTTTLWLLVNSRDTSAESLYRNFMESMKYIESIKNTFRTQTGRKYGPEIIDMGIRIGEAIYYQMSKILRLP